MEDLIIFNNECYQYATSQEKRDCQRSLRRYEDCVDSGTPERTCCRENDNRYTRQLRSCVGGNDDIPTEDCIMLGISAAQSLAYEYCNIYGTQAKTYYDPVCRQIAINECKGQIYNEIYATCRERPDSTTLLIWQNKCTSKIDGLLGPNLKWE